jgi:hypothetical protein
MTVALANARAMELAARLGSAFFLLSARRQAAEIGCSWQTWAKTTFYRTAVAKRFGLMNRGKAGDSRPAASLSDELLGQLAAQAADQEPSPLDDSSRRVYCQKRA